MHLTLEVKQPTLIADPLFCCLQLRIQDNVLFKFGSTAPRLLLCSASIVGGNLGATKSWTRYVHSHMSSQERLIWVTGTRQGDIL